MKDLQPETIFFTALALRRAYGYSPPLARKEDRTSDMRRAIGKTDIGKRRKTNQDTFFIDEALGLFIVADGMGGYAAGDVASHEAVDNICDMIRTRKNCIAEFAQNPLEEKSRRKIKRLMESAVQSATYMVYGLAEQDPENQGMGTTASVLLLAGANAIVAHVGDTRIYLIRDGVARQLTDDHTLISWQIREGILTPEEAAKMPHKNVITRAVGNKEYVEVDTPIFEVLGTDRFLLCSDGLHGYISNNEIPEIVSLGLDQAAEKFIETAMSRGGKDNITALVVGPEESA